ncbi:hypothetical protein IKI14_01920 [bacterium]|nr:hypothetical protein [bacterium]
MLSHVIISVFSVVSTVSVVSQVIASAVSHVVVSTVVHVVSSASFHVVAVFVSLISVVSHVVVSAMFHVLFSLVEFKELFIVLGIPAIDSVKAHRFWLSSASVNAIIHNKANPTSKKEKFFIFCNV